MPPLSGAYVFTDRLAFAAADWCFRLHGWPLCRRCWASTSSPTGLPSPPPTGVSACTAGLYAAVVGRLRLHRLACLRRCRLVFPPARLAFMPPLLGVYVFTDRLAFAAADWCFRLHGWPLCRRCWASTSSPTGLPSPPPTGVSACTAGLYAAVVGRLRLHRPACLRRRRLVFPPARLAFMPPLLGVYVFTDRLAFAAADWCFRLHGWPLCRRCWASTSSPTGRLVRRRLVFPPARLAFMPPLLGVYVFTDRLAFAAADWCFRLHGWPLCRRCWASTSSPTGLPSPLPTGVSACTAGLYAAVVGRLRLHRPAASFAADWCFRLHGWPLCRRCRAPTSSPTGLPSPPPTGVSACTAGLYAAVVGRLRLHRPACLRRCQLVFPPARLAFMPPLLGVYVFTDRPPRSPPTGVSACTAGLYAAVVGRLRLHRPACLRRCRLVFPPARLAFMPPLLGVYVFTDRPPRSPPTGVSACTAGLYAAVVGRLRLRPRQTRPAGRLVFPPARLAFMPPLLGVYVFTDRLAFAAADWCFRLHGWPIMTPTDAIFFTAGYITVTANRHHHLQRKLSTSTAD
uniref:cysteine dioxygenase n=2 Tax=Oryza sativa subsp. japonica TaxID=39947 RepID=Q8LNC4_ORYSJ|nr:Hypothetical protein [Oryza sativa Japonica Group]AAP52420.1 hypothetical protein LOC_Os10g09880 [Oryza sativa Japonica Group]